VKRYKLFQNNK